MLLSIILNNFKFYPFYQGLNALRKLYSLLYFCLLPALVLRLKLRARSNPNYGKRLAERFGYINERAGQRPCVWVHAVSVGEVIAASPMVKLLQQAHPEWEFCMTTTTPTGSDRVKAIFGDSILHYYLPYDIPFLVKRFLDRLQPSMFVSVETELWPNIIAMCKKRNLPVLLANARLSARSAKGYSRVYLLVKEMLGNIDLIAAQASADAKRFQCLGANKDRVQVIGSVKFDVTIGDDIKARVAELSEQLQMQGRKVAVFASTHPGEDELILPMISRLYMLDERFIAIVVPRHPERFQPVSELAGKLRLNVINLTSKTPVKDSTHLVLGDTMGDMFALYGLANVAFIGGSLVYHGGHNYLEAAAWKLPILTGKSHFNFQAIAQQLKRERGLFIGSDAVAIEHQLEAWLQDSPSFEVSGEAAFSVCKKNRGALPRLIKIIETMMVEGSQNPGNSAETE